MSLPNNVVTRFPGGVTNNAVGSIFANMLSADPTKFHTYFNDFDTYTAGDWVVTETDAGATQALAAGDGGWLLLTNTAADNDLVALQKTPAAFSFTAGKQGFFSARFKVSDATQSDVVIGLQVVDTTPLDVTDGIYFLKADGSTSFSFICRKNATTGSTSASAVATLANDTFITLQWYYDGEGNVYAGVNGSPVARLDASSTYLPDTITTVSFAIQNGEAVAKTMTVDYLFAAMER